MILSDIKRYLKERRHATLMDLAVHFDTDPEAMRGMLEQWIKKGRVSKSESHSTCNRGCSGCGCDAALEVYSWKT
jgi:putative ferrous iron transport protein C